WLDWFVDIEESHTSFAGLPFFRSPQPDRSWITAAGVVLDVASIYASTLDVPRSPTAELLIRSGYVALRRIGDFYGIPYDPSPSAPDQPAETADAGPGMRWGASSSPSFQPGPVTGCMSRAWTGSPQWSQTIRGALRCPQPLWMSSIGGASATPAHLSPQRISD